jgi:hypothetical protein
MIANILETSVSSALACNETKTGAQSWKPMSRKSFALTAAAVGLKNRALKRAYWEYVQQSASQLGAAVAHEVAAGRLVITGASLNAKGHGGALKWETAERFARHEPAAPKKEDPYALLAAKLGITVDALKAKVSA